MSWRGSVEWELRSRVSPEQLATGLAMLVVAGLIALFVHAQSGRTYTIPPDSTPEPNASSRSTSMTTSDSTSMRILILDERAGYIPRGAGGGAVSDRDWCQQLGSNVRPMAYRIRNPRPGPLPEA